MRTWPNDDLVAWWKQYGSAAQATFYPSLRRRRAKARAELIRRGLPAPEHRSDEDAKYVRTLLMASRVAVARRKQAEIEAEDDMFKVRTFGTC